MQKNKKLLYILIPATIIVWGLIMYKIFNVVNNGSTAPQAMAATSSFGDKDQLVADTFAMYANYRDPFLGKPPTVERSTQTKAAVKPVQPVIVLAWPTINYFGTIKNQLSKKQFVMMQIDNQNTAMKPGEVYKGVELLNVFLDSVEVKFNKEKKFVRHSKYSSE